MITTKLWVSSFFPSTIYGIGFLKQRKHESPWFAVLWEQHRDILQITNSTERGEESNNFEELLSYFNPWENVWP